MEEEREIEYEVDKTHMPLWERDDWRYAILMGGRGNGRSGTASRYAVTQLLSEEYTRGAIMRAVLENIRASCWGNIKDRLTEQDINRQFRITENDMYIERGQNSLRAHGFKASSGSLTARLKSLAGYNFVWIEEGEEIGEDEFPQARQHFAYRQGTHTHNHHTQHAAQAPLDHQEVVQPRSES